MKSPLIGLLVLVIAVAAVWLGVWPAWQGIQESRAQVAQLEERVAAEKEANARLLRIAADIERYQAQVQTLEQSLPKGRDEATLIAAYEEAASANGLVLNSITPQPNLQAPTVEGDESVQGPVFESMAMVIELEGTYEALHSFLSDIEHSFPFMDVEELNFSAADEDTGGAGDFRFEVLITTYYLN